MLRMFVALCLLFVLQVQFCHMPVLAAEKQVQSIEEMRTVAQKAAAKAKAVNLALKDKRTLKGHITAVQSEGFTFVPSSSRDAMAVQFADVEQLKLAGMSKGAKVAIGVAIGLGAALGLAYAAACGGAGGPHC